MQNINKIEKIFRLLGSDNEAESLASVKAIREILKKQNANFSDLSNYLFNQPQHSQKPREREFNPILEMRNMAEWLIENADLSDWEYEFLESVLEKRLRFMLPLSIKQEAILNRISEKKGG